MISAFLCIENESVNRDFPCVCFYKRVKLTFDPRICGIIRFIGEDQEIEVVSFPFPGYSAEHNNRLGIDGSDYIRGYRSRVYESCKAHVLFTRMNHTQKAFIPQWLRSPCAPCPRAISHAAPGQRVVLHRFQQPSDPEPVGHVPPLGD